ncbi:MAG: ATP-binding cassette domain-containing protein [Chloroflexota bacterium]
MVHADPPPLVALRDVVVVRDRRTVLTIPALDVPAGRTLAVVGPNGAGKTSLVLTLGLLQRPAAGSITFGGQTVDWSGDVLALRRRTTAVLQEPVLLDASVYDNVGLGLKLRGVPSNDVRARVTHWLRVFGIHELRDRAARRLSGGESRRVSLARAMALEPELLLLDEPFASVDAPTRAELLRELRQVLMEKGITTVLVTHDVREASAMADELLVLIDGRIVQRGTTDEVVARPANSAIERIVRPELRGGLDAPVLTDGPRPAARR